MKITNKFNLPDTIMRAALIMNERYDKGNVERSVTQLIQPPRIDILRKAHFHEVEKDLSEEWWSLFGNAVHYILELGKSPDMIAEQRLYAEIDGWPISGKPDLIERHADNLYSLGDYKVTTSYQLTKDEGGLKSEWEQQLNMLACLFAMNHQATFKELYIIAIVRDWQRKQAQADLTYPAAPVVKIVAPIWTFAQQKAFLEERVRQHRNAEMLQDLGLPLPDCSPYERWSRADRYAVIRHGGKRAARVYDNEEEAEADAKTRSTSKSMYEVEYRPGKSVRCAGNYCQCAEWCDQFARMRQEEWQDDETNSEQ